MGTPRSYLFVPGDRPDRFAKAAAAGADSIILDLEDAVGPDGKAAARGEVGAWFAGGGQGMVRINGADMPWFEADLAAAAGWTGVPVMVPKASPDSLQQVARALPGRPLLALVESVDGLLHSLAVATAPGVMRLAFGNLDFGSDARIPGTGAELDPARFQLALASRHAGLPPPIDGVTVAIGDAATLQADIARARGFGFAAKLCIHPSQVAPVNAGFSPTAEEIAWANRIVAAVTASGGAVVQVDGKMVDRPVLDRARALLANVRP